MKELIELCRDLVNESYKPAVEACTGILIERIGRMLDKGCWLEIGVQSPPLNVVDSFRKESEFVLVTNGNMIAHAYAQSWSWSDRDGDHEFVEWKLVGRDGYDLHFEPTHWMPMPEMPKS